MPDVEFSDERKFGSQLDPFEGRSTPKMVRSLMRWGFARSEKQANVILLVLVVVVVAITIFIIF